MDERGGGTANSLSSLMEAERARLVGGSDEERQRQLQAAERQRSVFSAWNAVCGATREGAHVTGLHYLPASDELVVYLDGASWTQEMTLMREIIRARMAIAGADVANIRFKTSKEGYRSRAGQGAPTRAAAGAEQRQPAPREPLDEQELAEVERAAGKIEDAGLKNAFERAMIASLEWSKACETSKSS